MKQRSPTLEGFRAVFREPSFALAEITWRWSIGFAGAALLVFAAGEYLRTLPVSTTDFVFLQTRQPALIYKAILHIFRGSGERAMWTSIVLALSLAIAWIVVAAIGRAATVKALLGYFRDDNAPWAPLKSGGEAHANGHWRSLLGLNFFRVGTTLAAAVGCVGSLVLASSVSTKADPAPGSVVLIFFMMAMLVWLAWSLLNWFLSLASIFVVSGGQDTFGALGAAADLCRSEAGSIFAVGTWFGLAHLVAFVLATSVVAFPLGFARVLPGSVVIGGVLLVTLLYFAIADFLYAGRLAAYVAILELPDAPPPQVTAEPGPERPLELTSSVDQDELIFSDIPERPDFAGA